MSSKNSKPRSSNTKKLTTVSETSQLLSSLVKRKLVLFVSLMLMSNEIEWLLDLARIDWFILRTTLVRLLKPS